MTLYKYYTLERPPAPGAVPSWGAERYGVLRRTERRLHGRHGAGVGLGAV